MSEFFWSDLAQFCVYGLVTGSILALGAVGISLTFTIMRFANFAHADLLTIGAYFAFAGYAWIGWPMAMVIPLSITLCAVLAVGVDAVFYRPLRHRSSVTLLISSFGVAFVLRSAVQLVFGPDTQSFSTAIRVAHRIGDIRIKNEQILIIIGAIAVITAVWLFLRYTNMGRWLRAVADNPSLAQTCGISTTVVWGVTWLLGGALAAISGVALAAESRLHPDMGIQMLLPLFAAAIVGGFRHPMGAILGGYLVGMAQELSQLFIDPTYKPAVAFALVIVTLLVRPWGILGSSQNEQQSHTT